MSREQSGLKFSKTGARTSGRGDRRSLEMNALAGGAAEILLYGDIGFDFSARKFIDQLAALGDVSQINLRINSQGGLAAEGVAIYQALVRQPAQRNVWIDAMCYSAATIVAMAASPGQLKMAFNARMMIHNGWAFMMGDKNELRKEADSLELLDGTIAATYAKRTGASKEAMLALMDEETWMDADAALASGFVDAIFEPDETAPLPADDELNLARRFKKRSHELSQHQPVPDEAEAARVEMLHRWAQINADPAALVVEFPADSLSRAAGMNPRAA